MNDKKSRLRSDVQRGEQARLILENPVFVEAMKALQDQIVTDWSGCPVRDVEGQKLYLQLHKLSRKFEGILSGMVQTGRMSQIDLDAERDESAAKRLLRRVT